MDTSYLSKKKKSHEGDISILNINSPNSKAPTFVKETLLKLKAHIVPHIITVRYINTSHTSMDRSWKQKLNREKNKTNRSYEPSGSNRYLWNISSCNKTTNLLLSTSAPIYPLQDNW